MAQSGGSVLASERQFNLVLALRHSERGLLRHEIFESVHGYVERSTGASSDALERMFERDKAALIRQGIPLETVTESDSGDAKTARYRIPAEALELPRDLKFTEHEITLLALASASWASGQYAETAARAVETLRAHGVPLRPDAWSEAPIVSVREPVFATLEAAITAGVDVRFNYERADSGRTRDRHVDPLSLVQFRRRWHLYAYDHDLGSTRTFLLARIRGEVQTGKARNGRAGDRPWADIAALELRAVEEANLATLHVRSASEAYTRLLGLGAQPVVSDELNGAAEASGWSTVQIGVLDQVIFARSLMEYGDDVLVGSPPDLRSRHLAEASALLSRYGAERG